MNTKGEEFKTVMTINLTCRTDLLAYDEDELERKKAEIAAVFQTSDSSVDFEYWEDTFD